MRWRNSFLFKSPSIVTWCWLSFPIVPNCWPTFSACQDFWTVNLLTSKCQQLSKYSFAFNNSNLQIMLSFPGDLVIYIRQEISQCNLAAAKLCKDLSHGFRQIIPALSKGKKGIFLYILHKLAFTVIKATVNSKYIFVPLNSNFF